MNEPVIKNAAATAIALVVVTQVAWFLHYFDVYDVDSDLALQIAQAAGLLVGIVLLVQGWLVRKRVTPTAKVALTVVERPYYHGYHFWLLLAAILCAIVFTCAAFEFLVHTDHPFGWLGLAVTFGLASRLP